MKKLCVLLLFLLALSPLFGQPTEAIAGIDLGQGWIDPDNTMNQLVPQSMLSFITHGLFMDEIDVMVRAPLLFGSYTGYTIFTAYGNYESWAQGNTPINPFTQDTFTPAAYQFGLAMPMPGMDDWRVGFLFGQAPDYYGNIEDSGDGTGEYYFKKGDQTNRVDVAADIGVVDYTTVTAWEAKDLTTTSTTRFITALNLGFMGASLYFTMDEDTRVLGGFRELTRTEGTDPDTTPRTSSRISYWGPSAIGKTLAGEGASGKAGAIPAGMTFSSGLAGQLSVIGMPLTAAINVTLTNDVDNALGDAFDSAVPVRSREVVTFAADGTAGKVSTYEILEGVDLSSAWDVDAFHLLPAATPADYGTNLNYAMDYKGSKNDGFYTGFNAAIDPSFQLAENVVLKPRFALMYDIGFLNQNIAGVKYGYYSLAQAGADTANVSWTYEERINYKISGTENMLLSNVGAALALSSPGERVSLVSGFYLVPYLYSVSTKFKGIDLTIDRTYVNAAGAAVAQGDVDAAASYSDVASLIGPFTGSSRYTSSSTSDQTNLGTYAGLRMSVPLAVKVSFFKNRLFFVGGVNAVYDVQHATIKSSVTATTATETVSIRNADGALTYTAPAASAASSVPNSSLTKELDVTPWAGTVDFMLRFKPYEALTIDLEGTSFATALADLDTLLSLNNGINISTVWDFLESLNISVTFSF